MRSVLTLVALSLLSGGCVGDKATLLATSQWAQRIKPKPPEPTPDVVELHYIFLERPVDDRTLNVEIWKTADELIVSMEQKTAWQQNGLRIGKIGSRLPESVLKLLKRNPKKEGRRHHTSSGHLVKVQMTDNRPKWELNIVKAGQPEAQEIEDGQGILYLTPTLGEADAVAIDVEPVFEFGRKSSKRIPAPDLGGWQIRTQREQQTFPFLKSELAVASGDYLLIGCWPHEENSIGAEMFIKERDGGRYQQVMLIRAYRPTRDALYLSGFDYDRFFLTPPDDEQVVARSMVRETVFSSRQQRRAAN